MRAYTDYRDSDLGSTVPRVVTIGNFDGVHLGHRAVLAAARREADRRGAELAVLTFEPHPAELLRPDLKRLRLIEPKRKLELLEGCGVDLVLAQRFDESFAALSAERFAREVLKGALAAAAVAVGDNFRFGAKRRGDVAALARFGAGMGFELVSAALVRSGASEISSSRVREALLGGDVRGARELLGRRHEVPGTVIAGRGAGRQLGFPTINLGEVAVLVPAPGIYAGRCETDGKETPAAIYIGDRPTLGFGSTLEAHLMDFSGDLYGRRAVLRFVERVREDAKFETPALLAEQMERDVAQVRSLLGATHG